MNQAKRRRKKRECTAHRETVYGYALDKLCEGKVSPDYVHERFEKLKQVK